MIHQIEANAVMPVRALLLVHDPFLGRLLSESLIATGLSVEDVFFDDQRFIDALSSTTADVALFEMALQDGLALAHRLRMRGSGLPLVIISSLPTRPPEQDLLALQRVAVVDRMNADASVLSEAALVLVRASDAPGGGDGNGGTLRRAGNGHVSHGLSPREREVLSLVARGMDNLKIAALIGVGERAVKSHVTALYRKLGCETRVELALLGIQLGLRAPDS